MIKNLILSVVGVHGYTYLSDYKYLIENNLLRII